ncbi:hypothetical protein KIH41_17775 [Litoribacter ruber]|uniref:hypothetical protein n=1 Tax=Litoribacter ruber TaxID=702568 RepID=UPI001BD9EBEB|nr:hypothetical protein [Litoribacter ruber]MBT0813142.1 hypothetical protein [Litoribacter ruber]
MKNIFVLLLGILSFCDNSDKIDYLEVKKVDFGITSVFTIKCDNFEYSFQDQIESHIIKDKETISKFENWINSLESDSSDYHPDVRVRITIFYESGKKDVICMSDLGILYNGKSKKMNFCLLNYLESL